LPLLQTKRDAFVSSTALSLDPIHRSRLQIELKLMTLKGKTSIERAVLAVALPGIARVMA